MTPLFLPLVVAQAVLLFWAAFRLSDIFLERDRAVRLAWFAGTFGLPMAIAWWGRANDPSRVLCGWVDCVALAVSVAFVRFWAVNREQEQLLVEQQVARQIALDRNEAARKTREAEQVKLAAEKLEAHTAAKATTATRAPFSPPPTSPGGSPASPAGPAP